MYSKVHNNIRAWVRSLLALNFFGERYYKRVDIHAKLCALILVGLLIWLYIFSLQVQSDASGPNILILDIRYWTVCFLLLVWGSVFAVILAILAETNFKMNELEVQLVLHRLSVREKKGEGSLPIPGNFMEMVRRHSEVVKGNFDVPLKLLKTKKKSFSEVVKESKKAASLSKGENSEKEASAKKSDLVTKEAEKEEEVKVEDAVNAEKDDDDSFQKHANKAMDSEELDDLMDTAVMILETQTRINPRRFLGANASYDLVKSYVVAFGTLIGITLSVAGIQYSSA
jgi:hypothetical protein